jgi:hypothetical protein
MAGHRWFLIVCVAVLCGCRVATVPASEPMGYLEGRVTIGPLRPTQRAGEQPATPPEAYAARSINVFAADGATLVSTVKIRPDGTYRVALPPGPYVVDLARSGIDRAKGLPQTVSIVSGQTVRLDVHIDTGLR